MNPKRKQQPAEGNQLAGVLSTIQKLKAKLFLPIMSPEYTRVFVHHYLEFLQLIQGKQFLWTSCVQNRAPAFHSPDRVVACTVLF